MRIFFSKYRLLLRRMQSHFFLFVVVRNEGLCLILASKRHNKCGLSNVPFFSQVGCSVSQVWPLLGKLVVQPILRWDTDIAICSFSHRCCFWIKGRDG